MKSVPEPRTDLPVLPSVRKVVTHAGWVRFHPEAMERAVMEWGMDASSPPEWRHPCHYSDDTEETVRWIFVLDVLNHCFWPDEGERPWTVTYGGEDYSGYWALAAALRRAVDLGVPITDAAFLSSLSEENLRRIFSGKGEIPLFKERLLNLREAGSVLQASCGGDIVRVVEGSKGSAAALARQVVSLFGSFRDEAVYGGERVYFWKRAQLFASDLHLAFRGTEWGRFTDIGALTAFADYKLPQVLERLGITSYHPELERKIDDRELLAPGSAEEIEIRAMTVWAVEMLKEAFLKRGMNPTSTRIDTWLWQLGQSDAFRRRPYHRTRTIFY